MYMTVEPIYYILLKANLPICDSDEHVSWAWLKHYDTIIDNTI